MNLLAELKCRKVFRVAVVYAATSFVVLQVADIMLPRLGVPEWAMSLIVLLVALGSPVALVLAWALELTPDGIRVTPAPTAGDHNQPAPSLFGGKTVLALALLVIVGASLSAGWLLKPSGPTPDRAADGASHARGSVAVLPFDNFAVEDEDYFEDAEEYFARALELTPGYATAHHWAGNYRAALGQTEAAVGLLRRALELDPFSPRIHQDLVSRLHEAGRLDEAIQVLERGAELDPGYADYHLDAWRVYASAGEEDRALEALLRAHALARARGPSADAVRAAFRDAGLAGAIRLVLERAPATFHSNFRRAQAELQVGDTDAALRSLERAVEGHDALSAWIFSGRLSEPLGDDPRYRALVRRAGLPWIR
jgi:hypothetical protein